MSFLLNPYAFALPDTGSLEPIETVTVGAGGASSITLGSGGTIPQTYQHLQLRIVLRFTSAGAYQNAMLQYNSDATTAYTLHNVYGDGTGAYGSGGSAGTGTHNGAYLGHLASGGLASGIFGVAIVDILDYASTSKRKVTRALAGYDANGSGWIFQRSSMWNSTAAITTMKILDPTLNNVAQYSTAALYGAKGS